MSAKAFTEYERKELEMNKLMMQGIYVQLLKDVAYSIEQGYPEVEGEETLAEYIEAGFDAPYSVGEWFEECDFHFGTDTEEAECAKFVERLVQGLADAWKTA